MLTKRHVDIYRKAMNEAELTLSVLAAASGLQPRTIRSWVAQGLLSGPLSRGAYARYPSDTLERVLAIRSMRDLLGMPLTSIRQELLVASAEQIRAHAAKATGLSPEVTTARKATSAPPGAALDYLRSLRAQAGATSQNLSMDIVSSPSTSAPALSGTGFEALERRLSESRTSSQPARKARAEEWMRIPVTPDVELAVRGRLDDEQRVRLERCADLVRDILLGRD